MEDKEMFAGSPDPGCILLTLRPSPDPQTPLPSSLRHSRKKDFLFRCLIWDAGSRGFDLLSERAAGKTGLAAVPGEKPDLKVGQALGDASAWVAKPTFQLSKRNLCTTRIHKV